MDPGTLIGFGSVLVAVIAIGLGQRSEARASSTKLEGRITALEVKIDVFWAGLMRDAATILHQPHPEYARRDELLEKLLDGVIHEGEVSELRDFLVAVVGTAEDSGDPGEKIAASILLRLIDSTVYAKEPGGT